MPGGLSAYQKAFLAQATTLIEAAPGQHSSGVTTAQVQAAVLSQGPSKAGGQAQSSLDYARSISAPPSVIDPLVKAANSGAGMSPMQKGTTEEPKVTEAPIVPISTPEEVADPLIEESPLDKALGFLSLDQYKGSSLNEAIFGATRSAEFGGREFTVDRGSELSGTLGASIFEGGGGNPIAYLLGFQYRR